MPLASYATGHLRAPNKDHLMHLSQLRHEGRLRSLMEIPPPPIWDSVSKGWVGPVKSQRSCGSCWDFSGTGMVEIAYNLAGMGGGAQKMILSEEYVLSCHRNGGCNGDDNVTVLQIAKATGLPLTAVYGAYTARAGQCNYKAGQQLFKIDDWGFCDGGQGQGVASPESIKAAIMAHGCVGSAIAADNAFSDAPAGQTFKGSGSRSINHDIILVGWDDAKGSTKLIATADPSLPATTAVRTAWKLRNSWDAVWCDQGYLSIEEGANQVGTEAVWATVTNPNPVPIDWTDL